MTTTSDFRELCEQLMELAEGKRYDGSDVVAKARTALATPPGPPKNCWLDDEPYLCPSPCVFDDPSEVISNCTYAQKVKCKTDCKYYRVTTPPPEPPTSCITFCAPPLEEVIRIDKEGFHYKGQFIVDAGEAHRLMLAFLEQNTKTKPEPPPDDELIEIARQLRETAGYLQLGCGWDRAIKAIESASILIEGDLFQRLKPPPEPPPLKLKRSGGYQPLAQSTKTNPPPRNP